MGKQIIMVLIIVCIVIFSTVANGEVNTIKEKVMIKVVSVIALAFVAIIAFIFSF